MPGGKPYVLVLQKIFWATAFISIAFIGALLGAIYKSGAKKHPVVWGYLLASWAAAWVALLPFFGSVWDYAVPRPLIRANVAAGPPRVVCNLNAVLIAYMWTVIPGFSLAFVSEVLRMLIEALRIVNDIQGSVQKQQNSSKKEKAESKKRKNSTPDETAPTSLSDLNVQGGYESGTVLSQSSYGDLENGSISSKLTLRSKLRHKWKSLWKKERVRYMFSVFPLISALPSFWVVFYTQASLNWRYIHADPFSCYPPDPQVRRIRAIIVILHLVPATILGVLSVILYFVLRMKTGAGVRRRIHYPLLIRLSVISILTGISAHLEWSINYLLSDRGIFEDIPPMYLISFPLVSAAIFVDVPVVDEWKSWGTCIKQKILSLMLKIKK